MSNENVRLHEGHAKFREAFEDEKSRGQALSKQQQQNRTELKFLMHRSDDLESLRSELTAVQSDAKSKAQQLETLRREVTQWDQAVTAQQGLQREAAQLRAGLA